MQGMACGLAVVSTTVGAINEAVQHDETGLMVPPRDPATLATALARLMGNDTLRQQMAAAGLVYARANFGLDVMLDKMEEIFYQCAETKKHAAYD